MIGQSLIKRRSTPCNSTGGGNSQIYAGNTAWTDYTLTVPIKLSSASNYPGGIRGRVNPATGAGYMLWLYPALGQLILYRASAWDINQPLVQDPELGQQYLTLAVSTTLA